MPHRSALLRLVPTLLLPLLILSMLLSACSAPHRSTVRVSTLHGPAVAP